MYHPTELIQDIQAKLGQLVQNYRTLLEKNKQLKTENITLAKNLEEAVQQQETLQQKLDALTRETLRDSKGLDQWKAETRREIKGIMKEMEKCLPQVETLLDK